MLWCGYGNKIEHLYKTFEELPFWSHTPTLHPPRPPKCMNKLRFVFWDILTRGGQPKIKFEWKNCSFLFLVFSISLKWGHFWSFCGSIFWYFEFLQPYEILLWSYLPWNMFWCGFGNIIEPSNWTFDGLAIFFPVGGHFLHFLVTMGSFWTTFLRSSNLWSHLGTPIWTSRSIVTLTAPDSLPPAQSESHMQTWDSSSTHTQTLFSGQKNPHMGWF